MRTLGSCAAEQQLTLDRLPGKHISKMLGVLREGVTEGTLKLQKAGIIRFASPHYSA